MEKRTYTPDDLETLRTLKMQEGDIARLEERNREHRRQLSEMDERLARLRQRAGEMAQAGGVELPKERHMPATTTPPQREKMGLGEVPSWEQLARRAAAETRGQVFVEDLLNSEEIRSSKAQAQAIDERFAQITGLSKTDQTFLTLATGIQLARWMMMPKLVGTLGRTARVLSALSPKTMALLGRQGAQSQNALTEQVNSEFKEEAEWDAQPVGEQHRTWEDILADGQQDAAEAPAFSNDGMNWLFGVINRLTGTHTDGSFHTVDDITGEAVNTSGIFAEAFRTIKEDWLRLPAAVYAQYAQGRAAEGEPVDVLEPLAQSFSPDMLSDLYTSQFAQLAAMDELTLVGQQAAVPLIINMAVGLLHGFMYNPKTDGPREYYDARTRKILIYSNALASASNLALTAGSENWAKLDLGGLIVSALRITQDTSYIAVLKDRFVNEQMDKMLEKELNDIDSHFINLPSTNSVHRRQ